MALNSATLKTLIDTKLTAAGFNLASGEADVMSQAIAEAVVEHIQAAAQVVVPAGSSAGTYPVT